MSNVHSSSIDDSFNLLLVEFEKVIVDVTNSEISAVTMSEKGKLEKIMELERQNERLRTSVDELHRAIQSMQDASDACISSVKDSALRDSEIGAKLKSLTDTITSKEQTIEQDKSTIRELHATIANLELQQVNLVASQEKDMENLRRLNEELKGDLRKKQDIINEKEKEILSLNEQIDAIILEKADEISKYQNEIKKLTISQKALSQKHESLIELIEEKKNKKKTQVESLSKGKVNERNESNSRNPCTTKSRPSLGSIFESLDDDLFEDTENQALIEGVKKARRV